jgi:hypothetical protein
MIQARGLESQPIWAPQYSAEQHLTKWHSVSDIQQNNTLKNNILQTDIQHKKYSVPVDQN